MARKALSSACHWVLRKIWPEAHWLFVSILAIGGGFGTIQVPENAFLTQSKVSTVLLRSPALDHHRLAHNMRVG